MDALVAVVTAEDTVIDSAIALLAGLAAQVLAVAGDKAATVALSASITAKKDALAAAVVANTPPPATP
jgi:hypothetical protein